MGAPLPDEVARLRGCLNDLINFMALPALSPGREPRQIVESLVDALIGMLHLVFVFVRLNDPDSGRPIEIVRVENAPMAQFGNAITSPQSILDSMPPWIASERVILPP
jgi:hypothetical protein